jgi:lysophospholipase L1-like esterase
MKIPILVFLLALASPITLHAQAATPSTSLPALPDDQQAWSNLTKYHSDNLKLPAPAPGEKRVIFFGDSITDNWRGDHFFPGKPYLNRGISGQTTAQMLLRYREDVIRLHPAVVLILAGTNDIAQNQGPVPLQAIEDNLQSMAELSRVNHIRPILCSVLPANVYPWRSSIHPADEIAVLNQWLQDYCAKKGLVYLNYFPALVDPGTRGMKKELTLDGVHPNPAGYAVMSPLAEAAIAKALGQ